MASLSNAQAIDLIKNPKAQREIQKAKRTKIRYSLHTEIETDTDCVGGQVHARFLLWVKSIIGENDNFERFKSLYVPPLSTNEFTGSIFAEYQKVFQAENPFEKFNFTNPELEPLFNEFRKRAGDFSFWETQGFEAFKTGIDNILIIDLPEMGEDGEEKDPYYYILDICDVIDICNKKLKESDDEKGESFYFFKTEYIVFWDHYEDKERDKPGVMCVFDDQFYRKYEYAVGGTPVLLSEVPHYLGYCPARSFWTDPLNSKTNIRKLSPITASLSELDWLLAYELFGKYLKLYAPFPIYAVYKGRCDYTDEAKKKKCVDGYLYPIKGSGGTTMGEHSSDRCPKCQGGKMKPGPGNVFYLTPPQEQSDPDLLSNPVKIFPAEKISVDVVNEEIAGRKASIRLACVGIDGESANDQAKNTKQIESGWESRTNKLLRVKKNFEIIKAFALETCARLMYQDQFVSCHIDMGDAYYDDDDEEEDYKVAKDSGLPSFDLAMRRDEMAATRYRSNPDKQNRYNILKNLDPFPDDTVADVLAMNPQFVDPNDVILKVNFNKFITRFEREQADLLQFGSALQFDKKISTIQSVLMGYVAEAASKIKPVAPPAPPPIPALPVV